MANKHEKGINFNDYKENTNKITMKYHFPKHNESTQNLWKKKLKASHIAAKNVKWCKCFVKKHHGLPQKLY